MKPGQFYWIIMIFMMSISYARARQGQALAKIRVDEKGNVEVLELNANEQSVETESFPLLNSWESENPSSGTVPYSEISSTKQIVSSESHTPVNPMGTGPDLTYVPENCSMSYSYPSVTIKVRIKNQGDQYAPASILGYYLIEYNGTRKEQIGSNKVPALKSGSYSDQAITVNISEYVGNWRVRIIIDEKNSISEDNELNNVKTFSHVISVTELTSSGKDLTYVSALCNYSVSSNSSSYIYNLTIKSRIINKGNVTASSSCRIFIGYYLSSDYFIDTSDILIAANVLPSLKPGAYTDDQIIKNIFDHVGTWYVGFIIDYKETMHESNENNNINTYQNKLLPDLAVTDFIVTDDSGPQIGYQYSIKNQGDAYTAVTGFKNYIYLSLDNIINDYDIKIDEHDCSWLGPGDEANSGALLLTVNGVPVGDYYLGVHLDSEDVISESNENNNTGYDNDPKVSILQAKPDLIVTDVTVIDAQGLDISYNVTVKNDGDGATDGSKIKTRFYLSPDDNITTDDYLIDDWNFEDVLVPGASKASYDLTSTVSSVPSGDYYLGAITDAEDMISESDENNNTGYCNDPKVTIPQPPQTKPDLIVVSVNVTDGSGPEIGYQYTFKNRGDASTGTGFKNYIYLSSDKSITSSDYKIDEQECNALDAGAGSNPGSLQTTVSDVPAGEYYLGVYTDAEDVISESNETNNTKFDNDPKVYILQSPPLQSDLIVTDVTIIDAQGLKIKYQYTIKNQGDGKAGPFKNYVYLSPDNTITQSDYQINSWECSELDADAEYNSGPLLQTTASSVPPGEYYLGVYTDAEDVISESQENNNTGYDNDPKVIIPLYSDMIVVSVNVKDGSGPEIGYQYTFKNRGNASTGIAFKNYIYLSSDKSITSSDYKIDEQEYNALDAGAGRNPGTLQTTVSGVPAGEYYLGVYTDAEDVIPELQENNNTRYADSRVTISEGSESPVETESCECNMITNWSFSQGMEDWQFFTGGAGDADCSAENGAFHAQITHGGDYPHEVTLHHYGLTIVNGNTYTVTFQARAEGSRNIRAWIAMSEEPWLLYNSDFQYTLTNEWQTFTYTFTMNYPIDPLARLGFDFGTSDMDVYLDNICLVEMVSSTDVTLNESSRIPGDFALFQNFPNPFNPVTTIRYTVPSACHVNLTIYDLLGREITTLVNETRTPGDYLVKWNGQNHSAGIYLAHLTAGEFTDTKKLILQK